MMRDARVYATPAEFADEVGEVVPTDAAELAALRGELKRASRRVDEIMALSLRGYPVDAAGYPLLAAHADALGLATIRQVAWWHETGDESGTAAGGGSIGSLSLPDTAAKAGGNLTKATSAPGAVAALRTAGLLVL